MVVSVELAVSGTAAVPEVLAVWLGSVDAPAFIGWLPLRSAAQAVNKMTRMEATQLRTIEMVFMAGVFEVSWDRSRFTNFSAPVWEARI